MIYTLKFEGKKYAYDSATGATIALTSLPFKMVEALEPPLEPLCPTSLRYELAKFDSNDVSEAYEVILKYAEEGALYGEEDGTVRLMCDGEYAPISEQLAIELLTQAFADCGSTIRFVAIGTQNEKTNALAKQVADRLKKNIL